MINNSPIFHTSFHLLVRRAECPIVLIFLFISTEYVIWSCYVCVFVCGGGGGGFINYMRQIPKTLMLILFDKTSLTEIRTPQPF